MFRSAVHGLSVIFVTNILYVLW